MAKSQSEGTLSCCQRGGGHLRTRGPPAGSALRSREGSGREPSSWQKHPGTGREERHPRERAEGGRPTGAWKGRGCLGGSGHGRETRGAPGQVSPGAGADAGGAAEHFLLQSAIARACGTAETARNKPRRRGAEWEGLGPSKRRQREDQVSHKQVGQRGAWTKYKHSNQKAETVRLHSNKDKHAGDKGVQEA